MWISFSILLLSVQSSLAERDMTPVFVLDFDRVLTELPSEASAFMKIKSSDFSAIIEQAIKKTKVVILFVEESFCSEDISSKDSRGTPFYHLEQALTERKVKYLPSVSQAFKTLKSHLQPLPSYVFYLSDSSSKMRIYDKKLRHFYIYFNDKADETRVEALRRHDLLIKEVYFVVRQVASGPVVAFYTGKVNPVAVTQLTSRPVKLDKPSSRPDVTIFSDGALFRFIGVYAQAGTRRSTFSQIPLIASESWEERGLTTRMAYTDFELEFSFGFKEDRWTIESVALLEWGEEVGRTDVRVGAPWNYSFVCSEPLVLVNMRDGSAVTISHYRIQPFKQDKILSRRDEPMEGEGTEGETEAERDKETEGGKETKGGKEKEGNMSKTHTFGPAVNCGPYFNAQILAGLMVTTLCLAILTYGVVSLYNVAGNSKYDDSQAKPLLIVPEGGGH